MFLVTLNDKNISLAELRRITRLVFQVQGNNAKFVLPVTQS